MKKYFLLAIGVFYTWIAIHPAYAFDAFPPLPKRPPIPENNPVTAAKTELGKQLYFDTRLSYTGTVSCNSCHNVMAGGEDGRAVSAGALGKAGKRSAPTVWNVAYQTAYYWDGRAPSIEALIKGHITSPTEMGMPDENSVTARIALIPGSRSQFDDIFHKEGSLTYDNIARAIATYIRTLVTLHGPFDRYLEGDKKAISPSALRGYHEFIEVGCASCHFWVNFSGPVPGLAFQMGEGFYELFPNYLGSEYDKKYQLVTDDQGRYEVTKESIHKLLFHMPSLRNIALTAPYFHTGTVVTLEEAVRVMGKTQLNKDLSDRQVTDITVFLKSLTGKLPKQEAPSLP